MSKRTFCNVTQGDLEKLLSPLGFKQIQVRGVIELVYAKRVDQGELQLSLRVFSGVNPDGQSRDCGKDAMRVTLFMRDEDGSIHKIGGDKRVNRIQTWRKNLKARLDGWLDCLPKESCECGAPMVPRTGKHGDFLGCVRFPKCKQTRQIQKES